MKNITLSQAVELMEKINQGSDDYECFFENRCGDVSMVVEEKFVRINQ